MCDNQLTVVNVVLVVVVKVVGDVVLEGSVAEVVVLYGSKYGEGCKYYHYSKRWNLWY